MSVQQTQPEPEAAAFADLVAEVLASVPLVDGHNDLPAALRVKSGYSVDGLDVVRDDLHTDLPRLRKGGVGAQFWSVYVPSSLSEPDAVVATLEQIDAVYRLVARYPDQLGFARTARQVKEVFDSGRIASLIGVEGGHSLARSLGVLRSFARLGVRYVTLTHNDNTSWADSATDDPVVGGLSDEGRAIVAELNRTGVLVDLSHVAPSTQRAAIQASKVPVIFSHSSARGIADHVRNIPDDVLEQLAGNGGVAQITFVPYFISEAVAEWLASVDAERSRLGLGSGRRGFWKHGPRPGQTAEEVVAEQRTAIEAADAARTEEELRAQAELDSYLAAHPRPRTTIDDVIRHVEHAREVAGVDHIGLGGDYDGVDKLPEGLEDVSGYPRLLTALAERGWSRSDLTALTGRNVLRVLRDAEDGAEEFLALGG